MEFASRSPAIGCLLALLLFGGSSPAQTTSPVIVPVGSLPRGVAILNAGNRAIVGNSVNSTLSVIDLAGETVTATIQNISSPAGLAVNQVTGLVVVANQFNNSVTVVDSGTGQIRGVIPVGSNPIGVALNQETNLAVVANSTGNSVSLVDVNRLSQVAVVDGIPNATGIQSVAIDPDLNIAAVVSSSTNSLFIVDLSRRAITAQIPVESSPCGVAIEPVSKTAVVANLNSNSVTLVNLRTNTVLGVVSDVPQPQAVAVSASTRTALVTSGGNAALQVVDLVAATVVLSITDLPGAGAVASNDNNGRAVVVLSNNNSVGIIRRLGLFTTVNGASFLPGAVSRSSIVSGFGSGLAPGPFTADRVPLPTSLGSSTASGVTVRVGGILAPLYSVSPTQINYQVPALAPGSYRVTVFNGSQQVASGGLAVVAVAPALFAVNQQGSGQAAALNQDNSFNSIPSGLLDSEYRPAQAGTVIQLFGTGGGITNPEPPAGSALGQAAPTTITPTVKIGGLSATVLYSGTSPGLVGVWQINSLIPASVKAALDVPVVVSIPGKTSNTVTIAVQ